MITLGKWLSSRGVASRRKSVELIESGKVAVNGQRVTKPYIRLSPDVDKVEVNGASIQGENQKEYYALYKPKGYVSSTKRDEKGRPPVTDLVPSSQRLYPVGRLDIESEGLLILTNDGEATYRLTHPKFAVEKVYRVLVFGLVTDQKLKALRKGVRLSEGRTQPAKVEIEKRQGKKTWLKITIQEGKFHQIRRMCSRVSLEVDRLIRIKEGAVSLGNLEPGKWEKLASI